MIEWIYKCIKQNFITRIQDLYNLIRALDFQLHVYL